MTSLDTYACAACGASDRERLYGLWLKQALASGELSRGARFLHFAPEAALSAKLRASGAFRYTTADISMPEVDRREDLMSLSFADETFDFFLCSHVLEHVPDDAAAIRELCRVTTRGGGGILMAPVIVGLSRTLEDPSATSEADRWRLFGQHDHVRLYAHDDYVARIAGNGFSVTELGEAHFGREVFSRMGLKPTSVLYLVRRPGEATDRA